MLGVLYAELSLMLSVTNKPFMLSVIMLSVIMLSVIMLSVIMLSVIVLSVIMLSVIVLIVITLSVIMLSVITTSVVAPGRYDKRPKLDLQSVSGQQFKISLENVSAQLI